MQMSQTVRNSGIIKTDRQYVNRAFGFTVCRIEGKRDLLLDVSSVIDTVRAQKDNDRV
jgi:hypothetical protein